MHLCTDEFRFLAHGLSDYGVFLAWLRAFFGNRRRRQVTR